MKDQRNLYIPALDGLRAIACLLVVATHTYPDIIIGTGELGVLIFFSLSGFLMGHLYLNKEFNKQNAIKYSIARFSRIVPVYYVCIAIYFILYLSVDNFLAMDAINLVRAVLFLSSQGVLWSIPPEIQFYAYFVLFWAGYNVFNRSKLSVFFFGLSIFLAVGFYLTRELWPGILLPNKFHVFFTGMLAAIVYHNDRFHSLLDNNFKLILAFSVGALFIAYNWGHLYDGIFVAIAASAIILVVSKSQKLFSWLETKFFKFIGAASFSIYLLHDPVLRVMQQYFPQVKQSVLLMFFVALLSIAIPCIFHKMVEVNLMAVVKKKLQQKLIKT